MDKKETTHYPVTSKENGKPNKDRIAVCQLTSAHLLEDERILHRMAWSLQRAGYASAVAGPNNYNTSYQGIQILGIVNKNKKSGVAARLKKCFRLIQAVAFSKFKFLQFHDPDLLLFAPILKLFGKRVIYDVHDDYEASILDRMSSHPFLAQILSNLWWLLERNISRLFDGIVVADRHLAAKFKGLNPVILGNFPRLDFTSPADTSEEETFNILYVGGVDKGRGIDKMLDALELLPYENIRFHVVGKCNDQTLIKRLQTNPRVECFGHVDWTDLHRYYTRAHMGIALYQPLASFLYCPGENSVKIIEYMSAGIPVLCSNFPGLKTFVEEAGYGITVSPDDPPAIAAKIRHFYENPDVRVRLGQNGRRAFETEYNWERHEGKLISLYERVLGKNTGIFSII